MSQLPRLIELSDYGNNWNKYLDELYSIYLNNIVNAGLVFNRVKIQFQFRPLSDGKGFGFWHLISTGECEEDRFPDLRRCERILWIPWVIDGLGNDPDICWHQNERKSKKHILIRSRSQQYLVCLAERKDYYLLKTAYPIEPHRQKTIEQEWKEYWAKDKGRLTTTSDAPSTHGS